MDENKVLAYPAKRFFVEMLTRDIELDDSILDLLDNCLDGAMRLSTNNRKDVKDDSKIYEGFYAHITMNSENFVIEDNCGGIPRELARRYAFRLGRPEERDQENLPTVGIYGIGMKRALFKMGAQSQVITKNGDDEFVVRISPEWLKSDDMWDLELEDLDGALSHHGTKIIINKLHDNVRFQFEDEADFQVNLRRKISHHYGVILNKGFKVKINGVDIRPSVTNLIFDKDAFKNDKGIVPYVYKNNYNNVNIELMLGFYRALSTTDEDNDNLHGRNSSEQAGWTIICNDRVVLYADKSRITGWGELGIPNYHNQFISIAGVVRFTSDNAKNLPITTTKRGIDGNSEVYLAVKDFMRDALKIFTSFTNKWKEESDRKSIMHASASNTINASSSKIGELIPSEKWTQVRRSIGGQVYKPSLPMPTVTDPVKQIKFNQKIEDIKIVSLYLFDDETISPSDVGKKCFDLIMEKAKDE
jgi:hypothetical protein